jgi:hypothetical protein
MLRLERGGVIEHLVRHDSLHESDNHSQTSIYTF